MLKILLIVFFIFHTIKANDNTIKFAFTIDDIFLKYFKYKDARQSLRSWLKKLAKEKNIDLDIIYLENIINAKNDFINNDINILTLKVPLYIKYNKSLDKTTNEFWSLSFSKNDGSQYCLISNKKQNIKSFKDIENKTLAIIKQDRVMHWLNKKVLEINKTTTKKILKKITKVEEESTVFFNVYFGKSDLGIISKNSWTIMNELNPSISKKVTLNKCSKIYFPLFIGLLNKNLSKKFVKKFFSTTLNIKEQENSENLQTLVPINHFYKISDKNLKELKNFYSEYNTLKKEYTK